MHVSGIPKGVLGRYRNIIVLKDRVAAVPAVRKRYEGREDAMSRAMLPSEGGIKSDEDAA